MRGLALVVGLALAGCGGAGDPCDGQAGTCIALTVTSSTVTEIDTLTLAAFGETRTSRSAPTHLPIQLAVVPPIAASGTATFGADAFLAGQHVGTGATSITLSGGRVAATLVLQPASGSIDAAAADAATDAASASSNDLSATDAAVDASATSNDLTTADAAIDASATSNDLTAPVDASATSNDLTAVSTADGAAIGDGTITPDAAVVKDLAVVSPDLNCCIVQCSPPTPDKCGNQCVDLHTDAKNCGVCKNVCSNGGSNTCMNGVCSGTFVDSGLINANQGAQINAWIGNVNQAWILCYRLSSDGFGTGTFHTKCDNRGPTVTLVKLNGGAQLIGGYASQSWDTSCQYHGDSNSFLFSLTNNFRYSWLQGTNYQFSCGPNGPSWGGGADFTAGSNGIGVNAYCNLGYTYSCHIGTYMSDACRNDFCGTYKPVINDLEVFVHQGS